MCIRDSSNPAPAFTRRETPPQLGPGAVRFQIVHIDAVLRQQGQHVLRRPDQFGDVAILQRQPQGAKAFLIVGACLLYTSRCV